MKAVTANQRRVTVDWIANRISLWALAATGSFAIVFSLFAAVNEISRRQQAERERIAVIAPAVTRALSEELLIGDETSINLLVDDLRRQFDLTELRLSNLSEDCSRNVPSVYGIFPSLNVCISVPVRELGVQSHLVMGSRAKQVSWFRGFANLIWVGAPLLLFGLFASVRLRRDLHRSIARPIRELANNPEKWDGSDDSIAAEAIALHEQLRRYIQERDEERDRTESLKLEASIGQVAAQVAHDIRSPLAALDMIAADLKPLPEDKRLLVRSAVTRIRDIANGLSSTFHSSVQAEPIAYLMQLLVEEKNAQYGRREGWELKFRTSTERFSVCAAVNQVEFSRIVSNLIDNSVQALPQQNGAIEILLESSTNGREILIAVKDNGKGIPELILPRLAQKGQSYGKIGGNGLGLFHAKSNIELWGGSLSIVSQAGQGTTVSFRLPICPTPSWLVTELVVPKQGQIIVLDTDAGNGEFWSRRFAPATTGRLTVLHSEKQLLQWWEQREEEKSANCLYLVEHDLKSEPCTGLDLIEAHQLEACAVLVSTHSNDLSLRQRCHSAKIRMVPRAYLPYLVVRN